MPRNILTLLISLYTISLFSQQVKYDEWQNLTTSGKLPAQCKIQHSNNNLDLVRYHNKYYLAFRTGPSHFASKKVVIYVVSSTDLQTWTYETEFALGYDLREPRFAIYHDTLNLYFFRGGKKPLRFEPEYIYLTRTTGTGKWTPHQSVNLDGFVPWRLRERNDTLYLSAYYGKGLYKGTHKSNLRLLWSTDAVQWHNISAEPQVEILNAEEGEFIFDKQGNMFATVRLEGTGSLVCRADKNSLQNWEKRRSKTKYDSALLFDHAEDVYLISRRNIDGDIDKVKNRKNDKQGRIRNLIRYSITRKVTSLFKLNKDSLTLSLVTDFPSTGDNAYAGIAQADANTYVVMNYSSDITRRKKNWIRGQLGKTYIYWTKLRFNP
ncbi:MAG TPA: hypothetical protein VK154_02275 [Chitinophagales bacterium]|nr:hypothetical protein [Chitinophagales bacterium]